MRIMREHHDHKDGTSPCHPTLVLRADTVNQDELDNLIREYALMKAGCFVSVTLT